MTAARPAIGSPCRSSGGRAVALQQTPRRSASKLQCTLRSTRTFVRGRFLFSGGVESRNAPARIAPATPCRSLGVERPDAQPEPPRAQSRSSARPAESTFPGNGARGPGVAAPKSTAAAPVFHVMVPA
jgi:hypothetical protein